MNRVLAVVVAVALSGCFAGMQEDAVRVTTQSPRPSIDLQPSGTTLGLSVAQVRDSYYIPEQNGVTGVPVEQWRATLRAGFANGLAPFFKPAYQKTPGGPYTADFTLKFLKADLEFTPVAIYRGGGAAAVVARITYMVQIIAENGEVVGRLKGEAISKNPWVDYGGSGRTAAEAVAQMYEEIADKALRPLSEGKAPAAPATKGVNTL